jgi:hypothetical protein
LKRALEELASTIAEKDETKLALRETLAKCASAMAKVRNFPNHYIRPP